MYEKIINILDNTDVGYLKNIDKNNININEIEYFL